MLIKASHFSGENEFGPTVIPLFNRHTDSMLEKVAAPSLLPEVVRYIDSLQPRPSSQYALVNAMGAAEFFGSNVNADAFSEASLIHRPDVWTGNPLVDSVVARTWPYGFPTFYNAGVFAHHKNKDKNRAYGEVELALWNPHMRRVELVTRVDKGKCVEFGGIAVWDKLIAGMYPDVSMGTKVKFDLDSIVTDWKLYNEALATFNPKVHRSPDVAVLEFHKKKQPIRGLAETRKDYSEYMRKHMNKILSDGRKVFVWNPFPNFFDISFVFIGADRTAKAMMHITKHASVPRVFDMGKSSAEMAESIGYAKEASYKGAQTQKRSEMHKDVVPEVAFPRVIPQLNKEERDLPRDVLDNLSRFPLRETLATSALLGMPLRPREFQRITLCHMRMPSMADMCDRSGLIFPRSEHVMPPQLEEDDINNRILDLLLPFFLSRSSAAPAIRNRVLLMRDVKEGPVPVKSVHKHASANSVFARMGEMYAGYRQEVPHLHKHAQKYISMYTTSSQDTNKLASLPIDEFSSALSSAYLELAFMHELG
jgi:hypothetical protein